MTLSLAFLFGGLVVLVVAADRMVEGAVSIAERFGISKLAIGLTVVAYGTSFPEMFVSVIASFRGVSDIAIGNVIGSNICNIGLVLGATALVRTITLSDRWIYLRDLPVLVVASGITVVFMMDGALTRTDGLVLLVLAVAATVWCLKSPGEITLDDENDRMSVPRATVYLLLGFAGLIGGAHFMVEGAAQIARDLGVDERIIGLTVVALGTSLPELAASIAGALKGHAELAVGNVVGSCLFNLTFVLGAASLVRPMEVDFHGARWDLVVMGVLTVVMWVTLRTDRTLSRTEGAVLLSAYVGYVGYLGASTF